MTDLNNGSSNGSSNGSNNDLNANLGDNANPDLGADQTIDLTEATTTQDILVADLEKAKQESKTRIDRLVEIGQVAAAAAFAELKGGSQELGTIAKNSFSTIADNLNRPGANSANSDSELTSELTPNSSPKAQPDSVTNLIAYFFQTLKSGFADLDAKLNDRYGDRYRSAKQQVEQTATWYSAKLEEAKATTPEPTPLEQKQNEWAERAANFGSFVAQKEQLIRERLKAMAEMKVDRR